MKLEEVLPALREGKKIKRKGWRNQEYIRKCHVFTFEPIINEDNAFYALTIIDLWADDWEIVIESKKVKLRDLTETQFEKWTFKNCGWYNCKDCVFKSVNCGTVSPYYWIKDKSLFSDKFLDQEIEVE